MKCTFTGPYNDRKKQFQFFLSCGRYCRIDRNRCWNLPLGFCPHSCWRGDRQVRRNEKLGDKKNLIGNFYPPSSIFIDTNFLESLVTDDIKSGIGEMLHFYFYANSPLIDELIGNYPIVLLNRGSLKEYIMESLAIKKSVIEIDEFDKGERNKFNYGHTFGHALETITDYGIKHGQAVTVGMDIANYVSLRLRLLNQHLFDDMHAKLLVNFPDFDLSKYDITVYFDALSKDKKNIGNNLGCILSEGPGRLVRQQIPFDATLKDMIRTYFTNRLYKACS